MESDESTDWPAEGFPEGEGGDLGPPDDPGLSDPELGYDPASDFDDQIDDDGPEEPGDIADPLDSDPGAEPDATDGAVPDIGDNGGDESGRSAELGVEVPGTDPDTDPLADDPAWHSDAFPAALDLDQPPEPVDGMPWSDAALLGDRDTTPLADPASGVDSAPPVNDLYAYDGGQPPPDGSDPWQSLNRSEDPATSSLSRFWGPGS